MIRVLIVEDSPGTSSMLCDTLAKAAGVKASPATQPSTALQTAKDDSFDVALVDLKLAQSSEVGPGKAIYNGIQLGQELREVAPSAVIAMYSGDIVPKRESEFDLYDDCIKAGADYVLARETLLGKSAKAWQDTLEEWTKKKQIEQATSRPLIHEQDWNTLSVLEVVGKETLSQLVRQAIPGMVRDSVRAMRPGYSGASLLWVTSSTTDDKRDVETILKVSNTLSSLHDELRRLPRVGSTLDLHAVIPHTHCVTAQGWHAIGIRPVKDAALLRDFLRDCKVKTQDKRIFSNMITDLLVSPAKNAAPLSKKYSQEQDLIGYCLGSHILDVLEQVAEWKIVTGSLQAREIEIVRSFVQRCLEGHWTICGNYQVARLHGDFHCRNVFVSPNAHAVLIDFGRSDNFPRLMDFATLDADLIVSVLGAARGADLEFSKVDTWFKFATAGFPFKDSKQKSKSNATESRLSLLRRTLHARMLADIEDVATVEYSEALLFQLLRYLRFPTTTAPKRILTVRLAAALIEKHGLAS